jgi:hypothetical protein
VRIPVLSIALAVLWGAAIRPAYAIAPSASACPPAGDRILEVTSKKLSSSQFGDFHLQSGAKLEFAWGLRVKAENPVFGKIKEFRPFAGVARLEGGCLLHWRLSGTPTPDQISELRITSAPKSLAEFDRKNIFFRSPIQVPTLEGYEFVFANQLVSAHGSDNYVGIWRGRQDTVIASFHDKRVKRPNVIASTTRRIRYLYSMPAIHGHMIAFQMLSDAPKGAFDLFTVNWYPHQTGALMLRVKPVAGAGGASSGRPWR